jgi:hypothetical protein
MDKQNYQSSITTKMSPQEVLEKIGRVSEWWANDSDGTSATVNDEFTVRFKNGDMYKMKVTDIVPGEKMVWDVIDSYQGWHEDHTEWTGTKIVWEVSAQKDGTDVKMTHVGLVPEFECYEACNRGWTYLVQKSLLALLNEGKGLPV